MDELRVLPTPVLQHLAQQLSIPLKSVVATIGLLDEGATVPFLARYRKEATGNLDEVQIRDIEDKARYLRELEDRRGTVLSSIRDQGKLTPDLETRILSVLDKTELEDLYLPYKPKRRTKAQIARERGLEPLALYLWNQQPGELPLEAYAATLTGPELPDAAAALEGARHIVSEMVSEDALLRRALRAMMAAEGVVASRAIEGADDQEGKYKLYFDYREPAPKIPSHRMLAIRRGSKEGVLHFEIEFDRSRAIGYLKHQVIRQPGEWTPHLERAIEDSYDRLLNPSLQTEIRLDLKDRSDEEAIRVFRENLEAVLLAPPAGSLRVLGIDPGIRTGCKIAVVDDTGKFLGDTVIYPLEPRKDVAGAAATLSRLIREYNVRAIAIGNGTGSREVASFVQDFLRQADLTQVFPVMVNESGASVYSASDLARQEFPTLDLTVRGAISIARRLQDPLAELVKVDPKSIGVGQYQHDVDQRRLRLSLEATVESCVNRVGVDLNTASFSLLKRVAGITERTAIRIVEHRNEAGAFRARRQLLDVGGFGPKTFEQAAGFLRIRGGEHPLDATAVHPESYPVVEKMAASLGVNVQDLVANPGLVERLDPEAFGEAGIYTVRDIVEELRKPGRDPRAQFVAPQWRDDVRELSDLTPGMILEGTVTNVTNFGAFVDVGVHQDGLVHISELSARYVKDAREAVRVGQIVKVKVVSVDAKARRIALSMKALEERAAPAPKQKRAAQQPSTQDKLASLSNRFRTR